jgi:hypothetical protein
MSSQKQLVEVVGRFTPKIVNMDGPAPPQLKRLVRGVDGTDEIIGE